MSRPSLLVLVASVAAASVGCAHCDTCDDFPAPCTGPNCGYPYQVTLPMEGEMIVEPIVGGPMGMPAGPMGMPAGSIVSGPITPGSGGAAAPPPPSVGASPSGGSSTAPRAGAGAGTGSDSPPPATDPADLPLPPGTSPFGGTTPN
ncbi:hypothetical protein [Tautonia sociabilis]|uniref:Uncharacterized protein n=1 Tax=Tautonia sociabilis TaxID=2080755 RepID=A0A432MGK7_9BACT|nr:hypothetical protein [Tautonia sociabilis]RUL85917.1 hypothetical protein TsocGM_17245 [Tautonia sociabilis]